MRLVIALGLSAALSGAVALAQSKAPVADAAMRTDVAAVRALLQQGADVNAAQGDGMTALHWAAERGHAELAGMLLYAGANVQAVTRIGAYTPLHLAARAASLPVVQALLSAGADVTATTTNTGVTPLHLAAAAGHAGIVTALVEKGADVNAREREWGQTPLIFAAANNRVEAIKVLMARGADAEIATKVIDIRTFSALDRAATERQRRVLETLAPQGRKPTASQQQAAVQAARELFASGKIPPPEPRREGENPPPGRNFNPEEINPPVQTKGGLTALLHAARQGHVEAVRALLDGGAKIDTVGAGDATSPLLMAVVNGQFDTAMLLIERGADPNLASSDNGVTPLWAAVNVQWQPRTRFPQPQEMELQTHSYLDVMKALLEKGADPNARLTGHPWYLVYSGCGNRNCGLADTTGSTAFWRAAYATDVAAMRLLLASGADPNIPTIAPRAPVRRGIDGAGGPPTGPVAASDDQSGLPQIPYGGPGAHALHAAAGVEYGEGFAGNAHRHAPNGWLPSVKFLIEEVGVDINARDNDGYNAVHHAAARGDNDTILYLVSKGADVTAVSRRGQTTADMANGPVQRVSPFPETVKLLEKLGSKNSHRCVSC
ncbi:MAG: ankyrin repeat domain-containing protein [Acidobacteriota bacterium]